MAISYKKTMARYCYLLPPKIIYTLICTEFTLMCIGHSSARFDVNYYYSMSDQSMYAKTK